MSNKNLILEYIKRDKTKLEIIDIIISDTDSKTGEKDSNALGNFYPFVTIHTKFEDKIYDIGNVIHFQDILSFTLSSIKFLPTLALKFVDKSGLFSAINFTVESSVINVYIKANNDEVFKPIHLNMDIVDVSPMGNVGVHKSYLLSAQLRLPQLFIEENTIIEDKSSYEALATIATELNIGFSSNEKTAAMNIDIMDWINSNISIYEYIKSISQHAYKDAESFFTTFIDVYYNLNFINVNKCFDFDDIIMGEVYNAFADFKNNMKEFPEIELFLSNHKDLDSMPRFIKTYKSKNNISKTVIQNGYKRKLQFFNQLKNIFSNDDETNLISSISKTNKKQDAVDIGGVNKKIIDKLVKYKYLGKQNENVHVNYKRAEMWNYQNLITLEDNILIVDLVGVDLSLHRFQTLPVLIYDYGSLTTYNSSMKETKQKEIVLNEFLSGKYIILYIEWIYNYPSTFYQKLYLVKQDYKKF